MKRFTIALAVVMLLSAVPAHADTFDFTWQSAAWMRIYETPTQASVVGPLTLSGSGTATFAELAGGGATLTFGGAFGGTLVASGDGTFNGSMSFPTADNGTRNGLGVLTPTADGFTVTVHRAASGPDAGATFLGSGTRTASGMPATVAAAEPVTIALTMAGLITAGVVSRRRRA
jgi:uncharacterized protein (TIGR03382 family)